MMFRKIAALALLLLTGPVLADERSLTQVIRDGDAAVALRMIGAGADVNAVEGDGTTPLHWAVYGVEPEVVKALLAKGARVEVRSRYGSTALAEAVKVANPDLVRLLIRAGARADTTNDDGQTTLMLAARTGVVEVARDLVNHGARVNAQDNWRGQTALMIAAAEARPEMTAFLISKGAQVNVRAFINEWATQITSEPRAQYRPTAGLTPLLFAARSGCQGCIESLLKAGAQIDKPTPDGITPLMTAIDNLHYDAARLLLDKGANPALWDWWGRTALYCAIDMNSFGARTTVLPLTDSNSALDIARLLLDKGVDPNTQLDMHRPGRGGNSARFTDDLLTAGATPLLRAAISFDTEAMKLLLAHGALVDLPNAMGVTPLMAAAGLGVSIRDPRGNYLTADVQDRAIAALDLLVKAGANVNARVTDTSGHTARIARASSMTNRQGQTALYGPINWGWAKVVQFLLQHNARVDVADAAGKTPLDAVSGNAGGRDHKNSDEIAELIRKATKSGA